MEIHCAISATERKKAEVTPAREKYIRLEERLKDLGRLAVAFSGGADSSFLAYAANQVLGGEAFAMTIWSPLLSIKDRDDIFDFAERYGLQLIRIQMNETSDRTFCANSYDRCYICKSARLKKLEESAMEWRIPWVLDGSNSDDRNDYRPGMRALEESKRTVSPLLECGFTKAEIRELSHVFGLPTAAKPAAACLASRVPTGTKITQELLSRIDKGELILRKYLPEGAQARLRYDGVSARIETDINLISELSLNFQTVHKELSAAGIVNVSIDERGYRMGRVTRSSD